MGTIKKGGVIASDGKLACPDSLLHLANDLEFLAKQVPRN